MDLSNAQTSELIDEIIYRSCVRGTPYIKQYVNILITEIEEQAKRESENS